MVIKLFRKECSKMKLNIQGTIEVTEEQLQEIRKHGNVNGIRVSRYWLDKKDRKNIAMVDNYIESKE